MKEKESNDKGIIAFIGKYRLSTKILAAKLGITQKLFFNKKSSGSRNRFSEEQLSILKKEIIKMCEEGLKMQ